jgi:hypothetical protein
MSRGTDDLIAELTAAPAPVRRLAPPMVRALVWLLVVATLAAAAVLKLADLAAFAHRASDPRLAAELAFTLATGVAGVIGAFHVSLPDRSRTWALLPLPFALGWLALSGLGCWRYWAELSAQGWRLGESGDCCVFLLGAGVPIAGVLLLALRRAAPLQPRLTALVGACGVAGLAGFLLQFFHPFDITLLDFAVHLAALATLIGVFALTGRGTLKA